MRRYILREYGSWGVMIISYLTGLLVSGRVGLSGIPAFLAISLYINSKQAFTLWIRSSKTDSAGHLAVFVAQVAAASIILVPVMWPELASFLPYAVFPFIYIVLLRFAGEHALVTEVSGFTLLAMSSLIAGFAVTGDLDPRLFVAVAAFFISGVFKVRVQFKKTIFTRVLLGAYFFSAIALYHMLRIPVVVLAPLADNLVFSITLYHVKLQTTGWLEMLKGFMFMVLMWLFYK